MDTNSESETLRRAAFEIDHSLISTDSRTDIARASYAIDESKLIDEDHIGLRRVLTYGTYDLLHFGHIRLLQRAAALGDYLIVGLSTDEFNASKGKTSFYSYELRREMIEAVRYVDLVIPETTWDQKINDILEYHVDVVVMGGDWEGNENFEKLRDYCEVVFLDRTPGISTTMLKQKLDQTQRISSARVNE